jgi:hypothetical protein
MVSITKSFFGLWRKDESRTFTKTLALFCAQRAGQWSDELTNLVQSDDIAALCAFDITYVSGLNVTELRYARQCLSFYSKNTDYELRDTEREGWLSFIKSEYQNLLTNKKWSFQYQHGILYSHDDCILLAIARKIADILGECPKLESLEFGFGPGSNANVSKRTGPRHKLQAVPACSNDMVPILSELALTIPHYFNSHINRLKSRYVELFNGRLSFVDKNALTKRSILIEPVLNTFVQKGIGKIMKQRLLAFGCNLYSQVKNQMLALQGSIDGTIATVDLKNASNRIALLVVFHLVGLYCPEWLELLLTTRTGKYEYKGQVRSLEMFSSMGNGFTFELESLIFYATALVVAERLRLDVSKVSVFGDDICIPTEGVALLYETLRKMGFEINELKSFVDPCVPFRESCGLDYYEGQNIRPFYQRGRWTPARVIGFLNFDRSHYELVHTLRHLIQDYIPHELLEFGPPGLGDGHIHVFDFEVQDVLCPTIQRRQKPFDTEKLFTKDSRLSDLMDRFPGHQPNRYFYSFVKTPLKDDVDEVLEIGDELFPLYDIYAKPSQRFLKKESQWLVSYDAYGIPHYRRELPFDFPKFTKDKTISKQEVEKDVFTEDDPYTLRGGWESKKCKIYVHT